MDQLKKVEGVDLQKIFSKLLSKWYVIVISLVFCLGLAYIKVRTSPKIYEVYSILKLNEGYSRTEKILESNIDNTEINILDKIIEIKSTPFIEETINNLDFNISYFTKDELASRERYKLEYPIKITLDSASYNLTGIPLFINVLNNEEFELEYDIKKSSNLTLYSFSEQLEIKRQFPVGSFKKRFKFNKLINEPEAGLGFTISLTGDPKKYDEDKLFFIMDSPTLLTKKYLNSLELETAGRNSNILYLRIGSNIIQKETAFLNTLMDVIIKKNLEDKNEEAWKTINFIDYQLEDVSTSLNKAESDLESIGYATTSIGETSVLYEQRNQLESQISAYNVQLQNLRSFLNRLDNIDGSGFTAGSLSINDPMIENLLIELTDLNQQRANLRRTATEANPAVQRVNLQIRTTKEALRNALNGAINNLNTANENLNARLRQTKATINRLPSAERKRLGIQRKFEFSDNTYDMFMQRKATAGIALATNESDWSIVEYAKNDEILISPKIKFIYLLAAFIGLLLPALLIILKDQFNTKVKSNEDVKNATSIPILGSIVKGNRNKKLAIHYNARSAFLESIRDLRISLQYLAYNNSDKTIGFTSSTSGEGKTFCAANLAIIIAQSGKRVIIVDADLRNSRMSDYFNLQNIKHGLTSYLIGNSSIDEIVHPSGIKNLDLILAGAIPPNPSDILSLPKNETLIRELQNKYDFIIMDFPPVGLVGDYLILSKFIDVNIYIARNGYTKKKSFEKINNLYESKKLKNLNIVLNDVKLEDLYGSNPYYTYDIQKVNLSTIKKNRKKATY